jgi:hypothetical protein
VACLTGTGKCPVGPSGDVKMVVLDKTGLAAQEAILKDVVLKRWVERCGADCVKVWNATAGQAAGLAVR